MKRLTAVPEAVLAKLNNEREQLLANMFKQYQILCTLPVRPARMRVYRTTQERVEMEQVIVPATTVYVRRSGLINQKLMDRDAITYSVTNCDTPFPYAHIYQGSGHLCLGNIFVPSAISRYNPQQPLETLFLHNDRNLHHGNASLYLDKEQVGRVRQLLEMAEITLSEDASNSLVAGHNMLQDDGIWLIGADAYATAPSLTHALTLMTDIYTEVFKRKPKKEPNDEE